MKKQIAYFVFCLISALSVALVSGYGPFDWQFWTAVLIIQASGFIYGMVKTKK